MKKQNLMLGLFACTTLALAAFRGGCGLEPCPDLYIACPELECPQGFKVDKSGCAICECVGEEPAGCQSDADCPAGLVCELSPVEPMDDLRCGEGQTDDYCGMPMVGQCVEPVINGCQGLDEWTCINTRGCEPRYEYLPCDCGGPEVDCFCAEVMFAGCSEAVVDPCFGAWVDQNGLCRAPDDGVYPQECCGGFECFDDSQCPEGFVCAFYDIGCAEGQLDCGMMGGICQPASSGCFDDSQCPQGFVCQFDVEDCPVADGVGCALPGEGQCVPAVTGCAALDEAQCLQDPGCEPIYAEEYCLMYCASDNPDCRCEPAFAGCVEAGGYEPATD